MEGDEDLKVKRVIMHCGTLANQDGSHSGHKCTNAPVVATATEKEVDEMQEKKDGGAVLIRQMLLSALTTFRPHK